MPGFTRSACTYAPGSGHFLLSVPMSLFCCMGTYVHCLSSTFWSVSRPALGFVPHRVNIISVVVETAYAIRNNICPIRSRHKSYTLDLNKQLKREVLFGHTHICTHLRRKILRVVFYLRLRIFAGRCSLWTGSELERRGLCNNVWVEADVSVHVHMLVVAKLQTRLGSAVSPFVFMLCASK